MALPSVRNRVTRAVAVAAAIVLPTACSVVAAEVPAAGAREEVARNVIFLMGDGMGQAQRDFLRLALAGPSGQLAMDEFAFAGSVDTSPAADDQITDSAAAATAFATGVRTTNGAIGIDVDGEPLTTVLERARDAGKATGLVTTAEVTDASPAAFAAHVTHPDPGRDTGQGTDRDVPSEIAEQYLDDARVDVILGGGADHWFPMIERGARGTAGGSGMRGDLVTQAADLGYTYVSDAAGLRTASANRLLGLFAGREMFGPGGEGEGSYAPAVPLAGMTRAALGALDGHEAGFFLVVEEAGIDEMARHNNAALLLDAGRALEGAALAAREFQAEHPDTLIVVASGHETGGMQIAVVPRGAAAAGEDGPFPMTDSDQQLWVDWSTKNPTGAPTPITADGPGAEAFEGEILNTQVFTALLEAMSLRS